ncbi:cytochrome c oxidase assembly factor 3, mitochondrial [Monosporozyma unispora]|nr:Cytochrome c oxidase assembly factor 3, mitochondrial [Kazachstania unispora]
MLPNRVLLRSALEPSRYQDQRTWKMTPAMIRARKPFFVRNMIGLTFFVGLTTGIYYYTYSFLHKDNDFADVPIPPIDEEDLKQLQKEYELRKKQYDEKQ